MSLVDATIELSIAGVWTDVTSYALTDPGIVIRHGASSESGVADPAECQLSLKNTDGRFTPDNPTGPYYGNIGRNTPLRVSVNAGPTRLVADVVDDRANTVDGAGLSITGDIDLRIDVRFPAWDEAVTLIGKTAAAPQRSYALDLNTNGTLTLYWSADGTNWLTATSTAPVPQTWGRQAVRATLDVNNGAAGRTITFYTAPTMSGTWTQLGSSVVQAGVTSIINSTAGVSIGIGAPVGMETYSAKILEGIAGTERANPDFTAQADGATSFVDAAGNTWTLGGASITNRHTRFVGEVSEFPSEWEPSEALVVTRVVASGPLRRLGKGISSSSILRDALVARYDALAPFAAYWPLEDGPGATSFVSAIGGPALGPYLTGGTLPTPQGYSPSDDLLASAPIANFNVSPLTASVPDYTFTGSATYGFLVHIPEEGTTNSPYLLVVNGAGTAYKWTIQRIADSVSSLLRVKASAMVSGSPSEVLNAAAFALPAGSTHYVYLELTNNGADVDWYLTALGVGQASGTLAGYNVGKATSVYVGGDPVNPYGSFDSTDIAIGHLIIGKTDSSIDGSAILEEPLLGYTTNPAYINADGESVVDRMTRLAGIAGVSLVTLDGSIADVENHGMDVPGGVLDRMRRAEAADVGGILHDDIDALGLRYVTRTAIYSDIQAAAALQLDYAAGDISPPLRPTDDDFALINDSTVTAENGSTDRVFVTTGNLNVEPYPDGVGRYEDSRTLALAYTEDPVHYAGWIVNTGTVEGQRFTAVTIDLRANSALSIDVAAIRPGNWIRLQNLPAWLPPVDPDLIVRGWTEEVGGATHKVTFNCAPADPYRVFEIESYVDSYGRLDSETTVTNEALDATETGVDYTGDTWVTTATRPGDFPFDIVIGGERMRVTSAVAGTFTVTRSINGVVKSHAINAPIRLYNPPHLAL